MVITIRAVSVGGDFLFSVEIESPIGIVGPVGI